MTNNYVLLFSKENALLFMESLLEFDVVKLLYIFFNQGPFRASRAKLLTTSMYFDAALMKDKMDLSTIYNFILILRFVNFLDTEVTFVCIISFLISLKSCYYCMNVMTCFKMSLLLLINMLIIADIII